MVFYNNITMPPKKSIARKRKQKGEGFFDDIYDGVKSFVSDPVVQKVASVGIPIAVKLLAGKITRLEAHMGLDHKMKPDEAHYYMNHPRSQELGAGFLDGFDSIARGFMNILGGKYNTAGAYDTAGDYHT
ncbi:MAG TPA: hypothetical protein VGE24_08130, partial [Emticicia sp.]